MIRIALVSYLNTRPFIDGLEQHFTPDEVELMLMSPAECARSFREGEADLTLVPVGALPDFEQTELLRDFCIGANGRVDSVFLFSEVEAPDIRELQLDPHSRTSNMLARILLREEFGLAPDLIRTEERDFSAIRGKRAGVAIGDEAYRLRKEYPYVYDLSLEWKRHTGLPFVFAVWAWRPGSLSPEWVERLRKALAAGVAGKEESAARWADSYGYSPEGAHEYITQRLDFTFDRDKHTAFLRYVRAVKELLISDD